MVSGEEYLLAGKSLKIYIHLTDEFSKFGKLNPSSNILDYHMRLVKSTMEFIKNSSIIFTA